MLKICNDSWRTSYSLKLVAYNSQLLWSRQESNLDLELRKLLYYPLYYETYDVEGSKLKVQGSLSYSKRCNITSKNFNGNGN
jgi:hypothetical protein